MTLKTEMQVKVNTHTDIISNYCIKILSTPLHVSATYRSYCQEALFLQRYYQCIIYR